MKGQKLKDQMRLGPPWLPYCLDESRLNSITLSKCVLIGYPSGQDGPNEANIKPSWPIEKLKRPFFLAALLQSRFQGPPLLGPIREWSWIRVLIQEQCQWNRSFQIDQLKISTKIIIIIIIIIIFIYYFYCFYNKSVSFFMIRANTNNVDVDRLLFFFTQVDAHILRPILYRR